MEPYFEVYKLSRFESEAQIRGLEIGSALSGIPVCLAYGVARVYMFMETFRTLLFLPTSAYIATWASNVPHTV
jgi:hypothetical protein